MDKVKLSVAERLEDIRKNANGVNRFGAETLREVEERTGISHSFISKNETGTNENLAKLIQLAQHYGVSMDYICGLSDVPVISEDIQAAGKTLGISYDAITNIRFLAERFGEKDGGLDVLDSILSSEDLIGTVVMLAAERKKLLSVADEAQKRYEELQSGLEISPEKMTGNLLWCTDARERAEYAAFKASKYFTGVLTEALGDTVEVIDILCDLISKKHGKATEKRDQKGGATWQL